MSFFSSIFSTISTWASSAVGGIGGWFVSLFLNWGEAKIQTAVTNEENQNTQDTAIDTHANQVATEMQNAQTQEQLDQADKDVLSTK